MADSKFNISIDSDDNNDNFDEFKKYMDDYTDLSKNGLISEFNKNYDKYNIEIKKRKSKTDKKKKVYIKYIIKNSDDYEKNELMLYDLYNIIEIYNKIKEQKKEKINNILKFFN